MFLSVSNYIFTVIFVGEMMMKVPIKRHVFQTNASKDILLSYTHENCFLTWWEIKTALNLCLILFQYGSNFALSLLCVCVCV